MEQIFLPSACQTLASPDLHGGTRSLCGCSPVSSSPVEKPQLTVFAWWVGCDSECILVGCAQNESAMWVEKSENGGRLRLGIRGDLQFGGEFLGVEGAAGEVAVADFRGGDSAAPIVNVKDELLSLPGCSALLQWPSRWDEFQLALPPPHTWHHKDARHPH